MSKSGRIAAWAVGAVLAVVFLWTVWPTPYRYYTFGGKIPMRENRFTGAIDSMGWEGWKRTSK